MFGCWSSSGELLRTDKQTVLALLLARKSSAYTIGDNKPNATQISNAIYQFAIDDLQIADEDTNGEPGLLKTNQAQQLDLAPGDVLLLQGQLSQPSGKRNPGGFDYRLYLKSQSIDGLLTVEPENIERIGQERSIYYQILAIKKTLEHQSDVNFSKDVSDLLKGVVFGEKNINEDLGSRRAK